MKLRKIGDFLIRSKIPIDIEDEISYNRVTIRINHNGVSLRDTEIGKKIGTKKQFILKAGQFIVSKIDARYGAFGIALIISIIFISYTSVSVSLPTLLSNTR